MHVSITTSLLMLNPLKISGTHLLIYSFVLAAVFWMVMGVVLSVNRGEHLQQPRHAQAA
jgi:hypothetical protein